MANEATLMWEMDIPIPVTVADGTAITKGQVLQLNDPNTGIAPTGPYPMVCGIAAADKIASDGVTKVSVYLYGLFKMTGSGNITVGDPVNVVTSDNKVVSIVNNAGTPLNLSGNRVLGVARETSTNGETLLVLLNPQCAFQAV